MHNTLIVESKIRNYNIIFVNDDSDILKYIDNNTIVVIDTNIARLYPQFCTLNSILIDCAEDTKTLNNVIHILKSLQQKQVNINTKLLVIGGGVLQDTIGFCASIYCRGIDYILVPTTLLAQTDSCVGGKTSINFNNRKNILGTFYPPTDIIIYPEFLKTLSLVDYKSGLGEIYKFYIMQNKIEHFDMFSNDIMSMIYDGLKYKIDILSRDEFDKGERRFLNYGHTFGHALESISNHKIPHGLAVVIGCMIATRAAKELGFNVYKYDDIIQKGIQLIQSSNLSLQEKWFDPEQLLNITKSDKKSTGKLTMVLVDSKPFLFDIENKNINTIKTILKQTYESIRLYNTVS